MLGNDRTEYIGTSECRLSSEHCVYILIVARGAAVCVFHKPVHICSRVGRKLNGTLAKELAHDSCQARYTLC